MLLFNRASLKYDLASTFLWNVCLQIVFSGIICINVWCIYVLPTREKKLQSKACPSVTEQTVYSSLMQNPVVGQENSSFSSFYNL